MWNTTVEHHEVGQLILLSKEEVELCRIVLVVRALYCMFGILNKFAFTFV